MILGRLMGWVLIGLATLLASGDVVLAFGSYEHMGLATGDLWMLLSGQEWHAKGMSSLGSLVMDCPAWAVIGPLGVLFLVTCRHRRRHRLFH